MSIVAIVLGHLSLADIRKSAGRLAGRGLGIAGLTLGYTTLVLTIAAILIPGQIRSTIAFNQSSAAASLRQIATAAAEYSTTYSNGYPPNWGGLDGSAAGAADCNHAILIDSTLATGLKSGYRFTYTLQTVDGKEPTLSAEAVKNGCTTPGGSAFTVTAVPISTKTGTMSYFVDQSNVIRESMGTPTADSEPIGN